MSTRQDNKMGAGVHDRAERPGAAVRHRILDAARSLFVKEGYEGVSMRKVAEKAGCSATTIYLYFRDKAEMCSCLCEEIYAKLSDLPAAARGLEGDPVAFLREVLHAYVALGLAHPNQYEMAFLLSSRDPRQTEEFLPRGSRELQAYNLVREVVRACVRLKKFKEVDLDAACQALWAATHGVTSLLIRFPTFPWSGRDSVVHLTIDSMVDGLLRPEVAAENAGGSVDGEENGEERRAVERERNTAV